MEDSDTFGREELEMEGKLSKHEESELEFSLSDSAALILVNTIIKFLKMRNSVAISNLPL